MHRLFISAVTATALAVAGLSASQASAGERELRNFIIGATTLAIIGAAIASQNDRRDNAYVGTNNPRHERHKHKNKYKKWKRHERERRARERDDAVCGYGCIDPERRRYTVSPLPVPPRVRLAELPQRCLLTIKQRNSVRTLYENRCLKRNYRYLSQLPSDCRMTVWAGGDRITGYLQSCLKDRSRETRWLERR